jgi:hypothetical protein
MWSPEAEEVRSCADSPSYSTRIDDFGLAPLSETEGGDLIKGPRGPLRPSSVRHDPFMPHIILSCKSFVPLARSPEASHSRVVLRNIAPDCNSYES